jgi:hypothetical protein
MAQMTTYSNRYESYYLGRLYLYLASVNLLVVLLYGTLLGPFQNSSFKLALARVYGIDNESQSAPLDSYACVKEPETVQSQFYSLSLAQKRKPDVTSKGKPPKRHTLSFYHEELSFYKSLGLITPIYVFVEVSYFSKL